MVWSVQDREYFGRRKDKRNEKRRYYSSGMLKTFVEHFGPGAAYGVKELWQFFETNEAGESVLTRQARSSGTACDESTSRCTNLWTLVNWSHPTIQYEACL